jgi:AmmeMemoRadiSam system protein A
VAFQTLGLITPHPPIMVPEVGHDRAEVTRSSIDAMRMAARLLERFDPETIVIMSPHAPVLRDMFAVDTSAEFAGSLADFNAPSVDIRTAGDAQLAKAILQEASRSDVPAFDRTTVDALEPGWLDHGVLVPMSFLDRRGRWPLVVLSLSFLPYDAHTRFGHAIARAAASVGRRIAFVASGDASHRLTPDAPAGYAPRARDFDAEVARIVAADDFPALSDMDPDLVEAAGECGLRSWITLGGYLEGREVATRVLSYEGPWGVGYLTAVAADPTLVDELPLPAEESTPASGRKGGMPGEGESEPVALARRTIGSYVRYGVEPELEEITSELLASSAGAFVSLHRNGMLRGCIGTITPFRENLAGEICHNAIQAATCDPRFPPVAPEELDDLEISVDVLHEPEVVAGLQDLDAHRYGVIVTNGFRRGLLLPDLEGVDTPEQQVSIAMHKAGIASGETVTLERFQVDRYH